MREERRRDPDYVIILVVLILLGIGLVMILSTSYIIAGEDRDDPFFFMRRQAIWILLGLVGMFLFSRFNYQKLRRLSPLLILLNFALLAAVYIPGVGVTVNEAQRWIGVGGVTVQPSEFSKLAIIIFSAAFFSSKNIRVQNFWSSSFVPLAIMGISFLLILGQPDLGTALIIAMGTVLLIFIGGTPLKHLAGLAAGALPLVFYFMINEPYRLKRLTSFLNPWADPLSSGYQVIQSLYALGPGGIFGVGLGRSRQKLYYLPEPHNDFIFAVIGEELGFVGTVAVLLLFFILLWRGLKIALMAPDSFGSLLAAGITAMIGIQVLINIGVVTGSLPVTGLNLPLVSAGGSSLFFNLCGLGILLNISRNIR